MATSRAKAISWVAITIVIPACGLGADDLQHLADQLRVEGGGDLVEQQQGRVGAERADQGGPLLLAAGQPVGVLRRLVGEPEALEQLQRPRLGLGATATPWTLRGASVQLSRTVRCGNRL